MVIGNGKRCNFWDILVGEFDKLREAFPRVYALAVKKQGVVHDFERWEGSRWVWEVSLQRLLFDWEKDQWRAFASLLDCIHIRSSFSDVLAWSHQADGKFLVGSFRVWKLTLW